MSLKEFLESQNIQPSTLSFRGTLKSWTGEQTYGDGAIVFCKGELYAATDFESLSNKDFLLASVTGCLVTTSPFLDSIDLLEILDLETEISEFMPIFDQDGLLSKISKEIGVMGSNPPYLFLTGLLVPEAYRGHRLGLLATLEAIRVFGGNASTAVIMPFPLQSVWADGEYSQETLAARDKLVSYFGLAGFQAVYEYSEILMVYDIDGDFGFAEFLMSDLREL